MKYFAKSRFTLNDLGTLLGISVTFTQTIVTQYYSMEICSPGSEPRIFSDRARVLPHLFKGHILLEYTSLICTRVGGHAKSCSITLLQV